jgi:hypothetical protein
LRTPGNARHGPEPDSAKRRPGCKLVIGR